LRSKRFLDRLRRELPYWVERGWVSPGGDRAILDHVAAQGGGTPYLTYAFSILGVLLLGSGIITYFAANWGLIPKLAKLILLFGAMWAAYGAAGWWLHEKRSPHLGEAMLLLGVILFGANIALIAQIYHIDAHFPNGVLLWSLGALLVAWLLRSQPALLAAIALGWLWTSFESDWRTRAPHWQFLLLWVAFLPLIYRNVWKPALHLALIALLVWSTHLYGLGDLLWPRGALLYLTQFYFLAYLAMFLLGMLFATWERPAPFAAATRRYGLFATLVSGFALTFPGMQSGRAFWNEQNLREAASTGWVVLTVAGLALVVLLALWHRRRTLGAERPKYLVWGQGLIGVIVALLLVNLFLTGKQGGLVAVFFNLLYFGGLVWLIYAGMHQEDHFLVNIAFVFFGITLLTRYFDTFWTLLNRSYFFMVGGLLLLVGGYVIERQRRRITALIAARGTGAAP
jgi:uncharacterized membrane protein